MTWNKIPSSRAHLTVFALLLAAVVSLSALLSPAGTRADVPTPVGTDQIPGSVYLSLEQVPVVQSALPVLRLSAQRAPVTFLNQLLPGVAPEARALVPLSQIPFYQQHKIQIPGNLLGTFDRNHLVAYADVQSGDAELYPELGHQSPIAKTALPSFLKRALSVGREVFSRPDVLAKDDTTAVLGTPQPLDGATSAHAATGASLSTQPAAVLVYVPVRRFVAGYPVYGTGSRALLALDGSGRIQSFVRRWKTGTIFTKVTETRSRQQVAAAILAQLKPLATHAAITVNSVSLAYYDGNHNFLQPVYRFDARIHYVLPTGTVGKQLRPADDDFVVGYVPISNQFEAVPSLTLSPKVTPSFPAQGGIAPASFNSQAITSAQTGQAQALRLHDPLVGRYVVRNDDSDWVNDANEFMGGLTSWWGGFYFSNSQYYWAEPRLFTTQRNSFVNSVNLALTEVHGNWWYFTTYQNWGDGVYIPTDVPYPGYGAAAGGKLDYWIIHSCEVIPSPDDTSAWADPWWNVFGGLHSVVGYRTIMYIDDDVGGPYGYSLMLGAPVVGAWLNTVINASAYSGHPHQVMHGVDKPLGRPSTISMCGRENDSAYDTTPLGRANCLRIFWYGN